jgi:hypothetical protein
MNSIKEYITDEVRQGGMWVVAFIGVCVLVGLGKLKPEAIEYLLFALVGRSAVTRKALPKDKENQ